jgi:non-canonical (house-cleaning) NTP pyrophosphatase
MYSAILENTEKQHFLAHSVSATVSELRGSFLDGCSVHFKSSDKVVELVERGSGLTEQESRLTRNRAIATGRAAYS